MSQSCDLFESYYTRSGHMILTSFLTKLQPSSNIHISLIRQSYYLYFNSMMSRPICDLPLIGGMAVAFCKDQGYVLNSWSHWPTRSYYDEHEVARCLCHYTQQDRLSGKKRHQLPGAYSERVREKQVALSCGLRPANKKPGSIKI